MMPDESKGKESGATGKEGYVSASLNKDGSVSLSLNLSQEEFAELVIDTYNYGECTFSEEELEEIKRLYPDQVTKADCIPFGPPICVPLSCTPLNCIPLNCRPLRCIPLGCRPFRCMPLGCIPTVPPVPPVPPCPRDIPCPPIISRCIPLEAGLVAIGTPDPGCKVIGNISIGDDLARVLTKEVLAKVIQVRTEALQKNIIKRIGG